MFQYYKIYKKISFYNNYSGLSAINTCANYNIDYSTFFSNFFNVNNITLQVTIS